MSEIKDEIKGTSLEIVVIGMSGRFPGARSIDEFWENLKNGVESLSFSTNEELAKSGVDPQLVKNPNYIKAKGGIIEEKERFDAVLFGYTPLEAEVMDPQVRIFHECVWEALEHAGYNSETYDGLIGLYAGSSSNFYWEALTLMSGKSSELGEFAANQLTGRECLSTLVSYKLNLKGPSFTVLTACSTSLVAIHLACQAILNGECHMAAAGGVKINSHESPGYLYQEGLIRSPDGHCRAFDAKARGTMSGNGVGVVVLKALADALADGDYIHAVIKGTAINNDGLRKGGYSAPSIEGQAEVIRAAHQVAEVAPETISYIEAHGTGTNLGDPIEIEALKLAFGTEKKGFCAIGSVKTNIGHLDAAAGVTGFIKTVLALKHRVIPPSLHFETPNPKIDFKNSPFYVNRQLSGWKNNGNPLRAGVSSFGIGGTNAHVVLEEWPAAQSAGSRGQSQASGEVSPPHQSREYHLILLSARTPSALEKMTENLAQYLKNNLLNPGNHENPTNPGPTLADAAYTLQVGRRELPFRRMLVCKDVNEAVEALASPVSEKVNTSLAGAKKPRVVFMFPGQGSQYVNMGLQLYQTEPVFRHEMDRCFEILKPLMGYDIKEIFYPHPGCRGGSPCPPTDCVGPPDQGDRRGSPLQPDRINQTEITQPVLFTFEYALAQLLIKWGIEPYAMIGHSIGEYVAAHLSGVFSLEDALKLVTLRGKLMQQMPPGSMLGVPLTREKLQSLIDENEDLSIAAVNTPSGCVVSGTHEAIDEFEKELEEKGYETRRLHTSHAFHSKMMEPIIETFKDTVSRLKLKPPEIPYASNVSGTWITIEEATNPGYWAKHLRKPVRFSEGIGEFLKVEGVIFVEIGPGKVLSTFVNQHPAKLPQHRVVNLVRHPREREADQKYLIEKLGRLWLYGKSIAWNEFYPGEYRNRIPLPTYPFERHRYWIEENIIKIESKVLSPQSVLRKNQDTAQWLYVPSWTRSPISIFNHEEIADSPTWLVLVDEDGIGELLVRRLKDEGKMVISVNAGPGFIKISNTQYILNRYQADDYTALFHELVKQEEIPGIIVHLWCFSPPPIKEYTSEEFNRAQYSGFFSLLYLVQAMGKWNVNDEIEIMVITGNMQEVTGEEELCPEKATVLGPVKVIPQEHRNIKCRSIDMELSKPGDEGHNHGELINRLLTEFSIQSAETVVAYRGNHRWVQTYEPIPIKKDKKSNSPLKEKGGYLVTGGTGNIGLVLAEYLAKAVQARLVLTRRSWFPGRGEWEQWLNSHQEDNPISQKIRKLKHLEELGAKVLLFNADAANQEQMEQVIMQAEQEFGPINGVIHSAGVVGSLTAVDDTDPVASATHFHPKATGLLVLDKLLQGKKLDFCLLMSSLSTVLGGLGFSAYAAANLFMDSYTLRHNQESPVRWTSIDWDGWNFAREKASLPNELSMLPEEGAAVFKFVLSCHQASQIIVSTGDIEARINRWIKFTSPTGPVDTGEPGLSPQQQRPDLSKSYAPPQNQLEQNMANIWQKFFGIEPIGIHDDFFELGGDSLKATAMMAKIHKEFNVKIPLAEIFNIPTVRGLAQYIKKAAKTRYASIEPVEKREYYALSSAQKRLYFLQQMDLSSTGYNIPYVFHLGKDIEKHKFELTIKKLVTRHESLRTSFEMLNEVPVQRIHKPHDIGFSTEYFDLPGDTGGDPGRSPNPGETIMQNFVRPFDLSHVPLIRSGLIKLPDNTHILIVDIHHIVSDGTSAVILEEDFISLYKGKELAPLHLQYKDFSQWQNHLFENGVLELQETYWLDLYSDPGEIPRLNLPTDYKRPGIFTFAGNRCSFMLDREVTIKFKALGSGSGATLYMNILAALNTLFYKYTGQTNIIIGTGIAGRPHADLQRIIGMFVNTLAIRNHPHGEKTYEVFLKEVIANSVKAFENQEVQFEDLVDRLELERDLSRNPLFDIMMMAQNFQRFGDGVSKVDKPGQMEVLPTANETLPSFEYKNPTAKFDMTFFVHEQEDEIYITIEYYTGIFKEATIQRLVSHFKNVIAAVIKSPCLKLKDIEIITAEEKQQVLYAFNDTVTGYPAHKTIHELFEEQVEHTPDNIAVVGPGSGVGVCGRLPAGNMQLSYRELNNRSKQPAYLLQTKGVKPDSIVGIIVERSIEMIIGIMGILKAGGAYLPIDPEYPRERIQYMLNDSNAKALVTTRSLTEEGHQLKSRDSETILLESTSPDLTLTSTCRVSPANLAYIIYTSGTTGKPKGVMIQHENVVRLMINDKFQFEFNDKDIWTMFHSYCFDFSVWEMYGALLYGGQLVLVSRMTAREPSRYLQVLKKKGVTLLNLTPSVFYHLMDEELMPPDKQLSLKYVIFGGEALNPGKLKKWKTRYPGTRLINMYGITETTVHVTYKEITSREIDSSICNIGKPIPTLTTYVVDRNLVPVPIGVPGELYVGGEGVGRGYLNNPQLTAEKFIKKVPGKNYENYMQSCNHAAMQSCSHATMQSPPHHLPQYPIPPFPHSPIYRTGDLGRWLPDGDIEFIGRIDHQVKIRGFRIEPGEIENQLLKHEEIREALVLEGIMKDGDKYLCAYIVSNKKPEIPGLREYLSMKLPGYMIPAYFMQIDRVPLTSNGKIDRKSLPAPGIKPGDRYTAPANEVQEKLTEIWAEILVLKKDNISIDANFFGIGGHSLKATTMVVRIHKELDVKLPLVEVFKTPTIRGLAGCIKELKKDKYAGIEPVEKKEYYLLSSAQKQIYLRQQLHLESIIYNVIHVVILEGNLEKRKLEKTFRELIDRHESLRTSFLLIEGKPMQMIHEGADFEIENYSSHSLQPPRDIIRDFTRAFDLEKIPLLRVGLIKIHLEEHILMVDMHHIITDATSVGLFIKEFMTLYAGDTLPPLQVQYKDYTQWQFLQNEKHTFKKQQVYWLSQFQGEIPLLDLYPESKRPQIIDFIGAHVRYEIGKKETITLKAFALEQEVTLFMLLLAIFYILLSKISGQEDIVIGSPIVARKHENLQNLIGIFINMLSLRNFPTEEKTFVEFLKEVKERTLAAYENQDFPYEDLVEQVVEKRNPGRNPLFDVVFALQNAEKPEIHMPGLKLKPFPKKDRHSRFDLTLFAAENNGKINLTLEYSTWLFKQPAAKQLTQNYIEVLKQVMANKNIQLKKISLRHDLLTAKPGRYQDHQANFGF